VCFNVLNQMLAENKIKKIGVEEVKKLKKIGKGSQSRVYMAEYDNQMVAVKELFEFDIKCIIHEIAILSKLESEGIPKFIGVILDEAYKNVSYVTSYVKGQPLDEIDLDQLQEKWKIHIIKQLSRIITFIHESNCVHRDLKAENVMINDNLEVFLIDFGISKILNQDKSIETRAKGTMNYLAPEIMDVSNVDEEGEIVSKVTTAVDVWAFCCLVSYIFSGIIPWTNKCKQSSLIQIQLTKKIVFPLPEKIEKKEVIDIIKAGTTIDLKKRKTMRENNDMVQKLA